MTDDCVMTTIDAVAPARAVPYVARAGAERAVLCDVDGTLALLDRDPYDETRVLTDRPNLPVIETLVALVMSGLQPIFMSGRTGQCRPDTEAWLRRHIPLHWGCVHEMKLYMRTAGDYRPDATVKLELFDKHVRDRYSVRVVLDDRDSVVKLWRSLGLTCLQVAEGAF